MFRLIWHELKFRRNAIIGWALGLCFFPIVYLGIYPQVADEMQNMQSLMELDLYQAMGMSFRTLEEWTGSVILVFVPLLASIYGIINGTGTLAGEEADGRLEILVTLPLPRWKIVTAKAFALAISLLIILLVVALASALVFMAIESQVESDLQPAEIATALIATWPLTWAFGMIGLFLGAFSATRRAGALIGAAIIVASYFGSNLAGMVSSIEPLEPFFLFSYLDTSGAGVTEGQELADILLLLLVGFGALALALFFFERRDLTVGAWPWQRARVSG